MTIFVKSSIIDGWQVFKYASGWDNVSLCILRSLFLLFFSSLKQKPTESQWSKVFRTNYWGQCIKYFFLYFITSWALQVWNSKLTKSKFCKWKFRCRYYKENLLTKGTFQKNILKNLHLSNVCRFQVDILDDKN